MAGMNKPVNGLRPNAWPMHGGLQTITNTNTYRLPGQVPQVEVTTKHLSTIPAIPEGAEPVRTKTPSPKKATIKVEPASGKENMGVTAA